MTADDLVQAEQLERATVMHRSSLAGMRAELDVARHRHAQNLARLEALKATDTAGQTPAERRDYAIAVADATYSVEIGPPGIDHIEEQIKLSSKRGPYVEPSIETR